MAARSTRPHALQAPSAAHHALPVSGWPVASGQPSAVHVSLFYPRVCVVGALCLRTPMFHFGLFRPRACGLAALSLLVSPPFPKARLEAASFLSQPRSRRTACPPVRGQSSRLQHHMPLHALAHAHHSAAWSALLLSPERPLSACAPVSCLALHTPDALAAVFVLIPYAVLRYGLRS
jgi:hypothetical protein